MAETSERAPHIAGRADDKARRLDPTSDIRLNPLPGRAFDSASIAFGDDLRALVTGEAEDQLRDQDARIARRPFGFRRVFLPDRIGR